MTSPKNGIYIVQGEMTLIVTAIRRTTRYTHQNDDETDPLLNNFSQLKETLNNVVDLQEIEPAAFLNPFLDVIRSEDTTGPVTGLALTSVNKFLSYGLIDTSSENSSSCTENIADAVTHARFIGTDPGSDEVVLMKILYVLKTLLLSTCGVLLTNESVCEIMQSCFRICFEMRLSELLRKSAENILMDMVQLLFSRLPQFKEDPKWVANMKRLKMRAGGMDSRKKKRSPKVKRRKQNHVTTSSQQDAPPAIPEETPTEVQSDVIPTCDNEEDILGRDETIATTPANALGSVVDIQESFRGASDAEDKQQAQTQEEQALYESESQTDKTDIENQGPSEDQNNKTDTTDTAPPVELNVVDVADDKSDATSDSVSIPDNEFVNPRGVRFMQHQHHLKDGGGPAVPYGLPCVRELFRFMISLTNPLDRHNTDVMIHMGLTLLTVALESGADHVSTKSSLLLLVKDDMCKNLFMLLQSDRLSLFGASLRICFMLFESMRSHLKFQLEMYLTKLMDIIVSDAPMITYDKREIALEAIVQLWRIPGLVTELYLNYDCDLFCSNLFEDLTKMLSKNAFPVSGMLNSTHLLSLDALQTVVDTIEQHCHSRILNSVQNEDKESNEGTKQPPGGDVIPPVVTESSQPMGKQESADTTKEKGQLKLTKQPNIRPNRMKASDNIPCDEELKDIKVKKKLLNTGTELFNQKPSKGITFLQEQKLLDDPLDPAEVVRFLRENPRLDKKMIGEYISAKKNVAVLEAFVGSFAFEDHRLDEALRMYLEAFRLPGEAPVISYLIEHFSDHWHKSNHEPFVNVDAAFTLTYAIIMLNVDQHNYNAKKQNIPMNIEQFKKNVSKCNGNDDFDQDMLDEIYVAIKNDEIVMPAEHTGIVRDNYLWKILLRRGTTKDSHFLHAPTGCLDNELFTLIWGPTVAALSFVFDKSADESIVQKAVSGFRKCAMISAHFGISDVFDNLVISLCKFTNLLNTTEPPGNIPIQFGSNMKSQLSAKTVFALAHRHGDILREGWKNILDCMLQLYKAKLLPKVFVEVEDFLNPEGRISLIKEEDSKEQRIETGMFSSLFYFAMSEPASAKGPTLEEQEYVKQAQECIKDCHLEQLISESKFLRMDSLQELIKALIFASQGPENESIGHPCDEDAAVFYVELLIRVVLQNRDRVGPVWQSVRDHIYNIIVNATEHTFLVERAVLGLLRIAIRLLRREEVASQVLASLRILLMMKSEVIHSVSCHIAFALHDLLKTNAANIHSLEDWYTLFTLIEVVGAGAHPPPLTVTKTDGSLENLSDGALSDSEVTNHYPHDMPDRGYTSDSELYNQENKHGHRTHTELDVRPVASNGSWLVVNKVEQQQQQQQLPPVNQFSIALNEELCQHDFKSLMKSSETLAFLVRDAAHVTPHNFENCVHAIRMFVEASLHGGKQLRKKHKPEHSKDRKLNHKHSKRRDDKMKRSRSHPTNMSDKEGEDETKDVDTSYHTLSVQLLDLMHTLHTRAASIYGSWAEESGNGEKVDACTTSLWLTCWCPLLKGIARLCCDSRRQVRSQALTYLQRALLVHDLQTLSAMEWEACFNKVLFPLLHLLLENVSPQDQVGLEETRMRASTMLCKVFLQHLTPLLSLSTFTALWLTILDFMDKYMHVDRSDLLYEAIPESLKNMLLVMETAGIFPGSDTEDTQLWRLTWDRIDTFLPTLRQELFKNDPTDNKQASLEAPTEQTIGDHVDSHTDVNTEQTPSSANTSGYILQPPLPQSPPRILADSSVNITPNTAGTTVPTESTVSDTTITQNHSANTSKETPVQSVTPIPMYDPRTLASVKPYPAVIQQHPVTDTNVNTTTGLVYPVRHTAPPMSGYNTGVYSQPTVTQGQGSVPLLLNPDIIHSTKFPIISPQSTPERNTHVSTDAQ